MALIKSIVINLSAVSGNLNAELRKGSAAVKSFAGDVMSTRGLLVGLGGAFIATKAVGGILAAAKASSDLGETTSKTEAILGDAADAVKEFADEYADRFGAVKKETLDAASAFGGLGKGLAQLKGQDLAQFSIQFTKLAYDLSSFANVDMGEATKALQTGLAGNQSDTLKALGVVLLDNTVKEYAYTHAIAKRGQELTEQQKVQARAGIIMRSLSDAQGDLAKTSGSAANKVRAAWGRLANLGADFGNAIAPATGALLDLTDSVLKQFSAELVSNSEAIEHWASSSVESGSGVVAMFMKLGGAIGVVADVVHTLGLGVKLAEAMMRHFWAVTAEGAELAAHTINVVSEALGRGPLIDESFMRGFAQSFRDGATKAKEEFKQALQVEPPSSKIESFFARIEKGARAAGNAIKSTVKPALTDAVDAAGKMAGKVEELVKHLKEEAATFGIEGRMKDVAKLHQQGATHDQLTEARSLAKQLDNADAAKKLFDETRTPLEQYQKKLEDLKKLFNSGAINEDVFGRAANQATKEFSESSEKQGKGLGEPKHAAAAQLGSAEAYAAIARQQGGVGDGMTTLNKTASAQQNLLLQILNQLRKPGVNAPPQPNIVPAIF